RRAKSLCAVFSSLVHARAFTPEFLKILLASIYDHAVKALKPSRPMFHNMAVYEQRGLADLAVVFDEFAEAGQWLDLGIRNTCEKLLGQLSSDGVQREWSGGYHLHVMEDAVAVWE